MFKTCHRVTCPGAGASPLVDGGTGPRQARLSAPANLVIHWPAFMRLILVAVCIRLAGAASAAEGVALRAVLSNWSQARGISFTIEHLAARDAPIGSWRSLRIATAPQPLADEEPGVAVRRLEQELDGWVVVMAQDQKTWHVIERAVLLRSPLDGRLQGHSFEGSACAMLEQLIAAQRIADVILPAFVGMSGGVAHVGTGPQVRLHAFSGRLREALTAPPDPRQPILWVAECRPGPQEVLVATMFFPPTHAARK